MVSICGMDCCDNCSRRDACGGCVKTYGHPFGGECIAAKCIKKGGMKAFESFKEQIITEINSLGIEDIRIEELNLLNGFYVNLSYPFANGQTAKLLEDNNIYLGTQIKKPGSKRCYGIVADEEHIVISEYGNNGEDPEVLIYKKR